MVPPKTDPKWEKLVTNPASVPVTGLVTKMLMTRLKLMDCKNNVARKQEGITTAYDFFLKNETAVKDDIKLIFG
ncbi:MAG: hypothetical protein ABSD75_03165 [Terriglobales bacterium]|jgi:hypothetical protein